MQPETSSARILGVSTADATAPGQRKAAWPVPLRAEEETRQATKGALPEDAAKYRTVQQRAADVTERALVVAIATTVPYCLWQLGRWWRQRRTADCSRKPSQPQAESAKSQSCNEAADAQRAAEAAAAEKRDKALAAARQAELTEQINRILNAESPYELLEVPEGAVHETIQQRYRRLLHQLDPHAANSPRALAACQALRRAHDSLSHAQAGQPSDDEKTAVFARQLPANRSRGRQHSAQQSTSPKPGNQPRGLAGKPESDMRGANGRDFVTSDDRRSRSHSPGKRPGEARGGVPHEAVAMKPSLLKGGTR